MTKKKTWQEKFEQSKTHQVKVLDKDFAGMQAGQLMLIPSPKIVDALIKKIPKGKSLTIVKLRERLAKKYKADVTCPIATGFVVKTVAEAAFERFNAGEALANITPVWRVLDPESPTLKKVSFDTEIVIKQRQLENI